MQTKVAKFILIFLGISLIILIIYFILRGNSTELAIKTTTGSVSINNPTTLPGKKDISGGDVRFKETTSYSINYFPEDSGFIISISSPNIQVARDMAEKDFIQTLDISQADACKLTVSLAVPFSVNEKAAGINYGLSFCPNGKAFPK